LLIFKRHVSLRRHVITTYCRLWWKWRGY